ncbi:MAG: hypothetical protein A2X05_16645 [Bacteroidetes bacterium GWE2_41_25]|nr:MAG: hypothetical protein A2X03_00230 [Bacteroidetes bacterium GWA2_40_15]OFX97079.1 MAG: hypothetical protein A2X06_02240 [Bacteroidetes bacterium GWC2_40_22]OFY08650.1 MAG: hypothetical protein A2X05_16645 [Bacteroidetes bacterium GWE2_41_25]HAM10303.1 hypothetical protein [Bacteroidales bacterium]HBH85120.1 hypothetical protein [Bacteroidales bacterium]
MAKISKNLLLLISIIAGVIYFSSCEKYTFRVEGLPPVDTSGTDTTNYVSYSAEVQPIFNASCVSCHKGARNPDLRPENSYASLTSGGYVTQPAADSKLYKQLNASSHKSITTQAQKNTIYLWISQGAKNNKK